MVKYKITIDLTGNTFPSGFFYRSISGLKSTEMSKTLITNGILLNVSY